MDDTAFVSKTKKDISSTVKAWKERKTKENVPKPGEMAIGFTYPNKIVLNSHWLISGKLWQDWATWWTM